MVGRMLSLPGNVVIREWHFVEMKNLTDDQKEAIRDLLKSKTVQVSQLRGGLPLDKVDLTVTPKPGV